MAYFRYFVIYAADCYAALSLPPMLYITDCRFFR